MDPYICPLASGSKGNCIFISTKEAKILIDVGISERQLTSRLNQIGVSLSEITAILITHEHMDHIMGLKTLYKRDIPILANSDTAKGIYQNLGILPKFMLFTSGEAFDFQGLRVLPFSVQHDTLDPVGFVIWIGGIKIGICTDLGFVSTLVKNNLKGCNYLYLEANHEESMVYASLRPQAYKKRVLGRQGHLSNESCAKLIEAILHPKLEHLYLAHLSSECNAKEKALNLIKNILTKHALSCEISIAHQDQISDLIKLSK